MDNSANNQQTQAVTPVQNMVSKMQPPAAQAPALPQVENKNDSPTPTGTEVQASSTSAQPVSAPLTKEHEPRSTMPDVVKMTETQIVQEEVKVEKELEGIVSQSPNTEIPNIPPEAKNAGLEHAKEDTPLVSSPTSTVIMPMTFEEAQLTQKKYRFRDSIAWLADIIIYHFKKISRKPEDDTSGFG